MLSCCIFYWLAERYWFFTVCPWMRIFCNYLRYSTNHYFLLLFRTLTVANSASLFTELTLCIILHRNSIVEEVLEKEKTLTNHHRDIFLSQYFFIYKVTFHVVQGVQTNLTIEYFSVKMEKYDINSNQAT